MKDMLSQCCLDTWQKYSCESHLENVVVVHVISFIYIVG